MVTHVEAPHPNDGLHGRAAILSAPPSSTVHGSPPLPQPIPRARRQWSLHDLTARPLEGRLPEIIRLKSGSKSAQEARKRFIVKMDLAFSESLKQDVSRPNTWRFTPAKSRKSCTAGHPLAPGPWPVAHLPHRYLTSDRDQAAPREQRSRHNQSSLLETLATS